jgi:hypothetical protein
MAHAHTSGGGGGAEEQALFEAAEEGNTTTVVALLEAGTNANCRNNVRLSVYVSLCVRRGSGFIVWGLVQDIWVYG